AGNVRFVKVLRMNYPEKDSRFKCCLVWASEDVYSVVDLGDGRRDPKRWTEISQRAFKNLLMDGLVHSVDVSLKCAQEMIALKHPLLKFPRVYDAVRNKLERRRGLYELKANRSKSLRELADEDGTSESGGDPYRAV